jgi:hypothetical protein
MRRIDFYVVVVLTTSWNICAFAQEPDVTKMIVESDPAIQEQFKRTYRAFFERPGAGNCDAYSELQTLRERGKDKGEIVKQLAIFVVTTSSEEDEHVLGAWGMLHAIDLPPSIPIRVLAPYLDAENEKLRDFARGWFQYHDSNSHIHGQPPLGSVNYYDYMQYVRSRFMKNEEIPPAFVDYLFEKQPGKALLVFAYADPNRLAVAQLKDMREILDARLQGRATSPVELQQQREKGRQHADNRQQARTERSELLLAEHIVSDAIWLQENKFAERFQRALPEATAELAKLAKHPQWWARLCVVYIMRKNPELRDRDVMEQLQKDSNALVSKAAKSVKE